MTFKKKLTLLIWNFEPQVTPNSEYFQAPARSHRWAVSAQKPFPAVKSSHCRFVSLMVTALCVWGKMLSQLPQSTQSELLWMAGDRFTCLPCPLSRLLKICMRIFKRDSLQEQGRRNQDQAAQLLVLEFTLPLLPVAWQELNTFLLFLVFQSPLLLSPHSQSAITFHCDPGDSQDSHFACRWNLNHGKHQELNVCSSN